MPEGVSFPELPRTDADIEAYYLGEFSRVRRGEAVWLQRNFESDFGRVLDYYADNKHLGFIQQDSDSYLCDAYHMVGVVEPVIVAEQVDFDSAAEALLDFLKSNGELDNTA